MTAEHAEVEERRLLESRACSAVKLNLEHRGHEILGFGRDEDADQWYVESRANGVRHLTFVTFYGEDDGEPLADNPNVDWLTPELAHEIMVHLVQVHDKAQPDLINSAIIRQIAESRAFLRFMTDFAPTEVDS